MRVPYWTLDSGCLFSRIAAEVVALQSTGQGELEQRVIELGGWKPGVPITPCEPETVAPGLSRGGIVGWWQAALAGADAEGDATEITPGGEGMSTMRYVHSASLQGPDTGEHSAVEGAARVWRVRWLSVRLRLSDGARLAAAGSGKHGSDRRGASNAAAPSSAGVVSQRLVLDLFERITA